mmetsp:Transcript_63900/g.113647  ORF Transcript_63900/g.113647 Transcript_63900/m.113647 type:complete len:254 (+) Transcript_63900:76-837(+)
MASAAKTNMPRTGAIMARKRKKQLVRACKKLRENVVAMLGFDYLINNYVICKLWNSCAMDAHQYERSGQRTGSTLWRTTRRLTLVLHTATTVCGGGYSRLAHHLRPNSIFSLYASPWRLNRKKGYTVNQSRAQMPVYENKKIMKGSCKGVFSLPMLRRITKRTRPKCTQRTGYKYSRNRAWNAFGSNQMKSMHVCIVGIAKTFTLLRVLNAGGMTVKMPRLIKIMATKYTPEAKTRACIRSVYAATKAREPRR